jgi:hypothetical protein
MARRSKQLLGKVQIQKFVYLMDALSALFDMLPLQGGYRTYKRGPWDPFVQNAVDALAFRGLVRISDARELESGEVAAIYELTDVGEHLIERLRGNVAFAERIRAADEIARQLDKIGWTRLRELVYAEPTYVVARIEGFGRQLSPAEGFEASTKALVAVIRDALAVAWPGLTVDRTMVIEVFFRFLDAYSRPAAYRREGPAWT